MNSILVEILKCILLGVIWAALLMPIIFKKGSALKYIISVVLIALLCYFFIGYAGLINKMTIIALITLVVSWITSMAVFSNESKVKSKIISFTCVMASLGYFISTFIHVEIL
ncbi:MAG: hypothetical protein RR313_02900 [Anaerovoracaceae bacterium]